MSGVRPRLRLRAAVMGLAVAVVSCRSGTAPPTRQLWILSALDAARLPDSLGQVIVVADTLRRWSSGSFTQEVWLRNANDSLVYSRTDRGRWTTTTNDPYGFTATDSLFGSAAGGYAVIGGDCSRSAVGIIAMDIISDYDGALGRHGWVFDERCPPA